MKSETWHGTIVGRDPGQAGWTVLPDGADDPYPNVPGVASAAYVIGQRVQCVHVFGDPQMPQIVDRGRRQWVIATKLRKGQAWPLFRGDARRSGAQQMLGTPIALVMPSSPLDAHAAASVRASAEALLLVTPDGLRQFKRNLAPVAWSNAFVPDFAVCYEGLFYLASSGQLLRFAPLSTEVLAGADLGNIDLEPLFLDASLGARRLWVVDTTDTASWLLRAVDADDLTTVRASVTVSWSNYSSDHQPPNSIIPSEGSPPAFPIFFYNAPTDQLLHSTFRSRSNIAAGNRLVLQGNDQDWRDASSAELADPHAYERVWRHSYARLTDRPQLRCLGMDASSPGGQVWSVDGATGGAEWRSFVPLMATPTHLVAHYSSTVLTPFSFRFPTYNLDTAAAADRLSAGHDDGHNFFGTPYWDPTSPVPPWYWKTAWFNSRKDAVLASLAPTFSAPVTRDAQTSCTHGLMTVRLEDGTTSATTETHGPGPRHPDEASSSIERQYFDTGDAGCSLHSDDLGAHPPRLMFTGTSEVLVGVASDAGDTDLRTIFDLDPDQFIVSLVALEEYQTDPWTAWDHTYKYAAGDYMGYVFDGRYQSTPIVFMDAEGHWGYLENHPAPFTWDRMDEFGTSEPWPYPSNYYAGGYTIWDYSTVAGVTTLYRGHAQYRLRPDGTFDEAAIPFENTTDPVGRHSHHTTQITYYAHVIRAAYVQCTVPNLANGWDPFNDVLASFDGHDHAICLPRCLDTYSGDWPGVGDTYCPETTTAPQATEHLSNDPWGQCRYVPPHDTEATLRCYRLPGLEQVWELNPQTSDGSYINVHRTPAAAVLAYESQTILLLLLENHVYRIRCTDGTVLERVAFPGSDWTTAEIVVVDATAYIGTDVGTYCVPV